MNNERPRSIVVMFGDSTTLCNHNGAGAKITDYIQAYLTQKNLNAVVVNSGVGSDTAKGGYARLQESVVAHDPDVVTISFGLNDTGLLTADEYRECLEKIVQGIQRKTRARILLVTSTPFNNARHAWGKQFSARGGLDEYLDANICANTRNLAEKYGLPVCDLHRYFADKFKKVAALKDILLLPDGVHPTDEGNRVAAEWLAPMVAALLSGPKSDDN